ncbi:hypothetical protein [Actinokineospora pegani]|uniref:hypothetical protein n=1 Tax=Actinokineospora pegani TaxID=2654637 RepID=UPI0012EA9050|nr:hypothetical protein [Actinokineospora pegani]
MGITDHPALADRVVDLLARLPRMEGGDRRTADDVFAAVIARLAQSRRTATFDVFEADPTSPARRAALAQVLTTELETTPEFLATIQDLLPSRPHRPDRRTPGLPVVAIGLAIGGLLAATAGLVTALATPPPLDGTAACRTFFGLEQDAQKAFLARVFQDRGEPARAKEPYIVASILYACGQRPESTVNQIIDASG